MAAVAQLKAVVGLDTKAYKAGMNQIKSQNQSMKQSMSSIGRVIGVSFGAAAAVAAISKVGGAIKSWAEEASLAARKVGVLTSEMIALRRVAIQSGTDMGAMQRILSKLQTELFRAATGTATSAKKFKDLGLSVGELTKMKPADMLEAVAVAAQQTERPLVLLTELFGERLGPNAMIALKDIAENGLPSINKELGIAADNIELMGSKWDKFWDKVKASSLQATVKIGNQYEDYNAGLGGMIAGILTGNNPFDMGAEELEQTRKNRQRDLDKMTADRIKQQEDAAKQTAAAYVASLEDNLRKEEGKLADALAKVEGKTRGGRPEASSLERVGASFGTGRQFLPAAERQIAIQRQQLKLTEESNEKLAELKEALDQARGDPK